MIGLANGEEPLAFVSPRICDFFCHLFCSCDRSVSAFPRLAVMSSVDKEIASHEVGLDQSLQDDRDMERLGKSQQLKVS